MLQAMPQLTPDSDSTSQGFPGRLRVSRLAGSLSILLPAWLLLFLSALHTVAAEAAATPPNRPSDFLIQTWGIEEGLPQSSVNALVQTPDGYIWFGTFDGLVRFDGVRFKVFGQQPTTGLPFSRIVNLRVDKAGRLWIKPTQNETIAVLEKGVFRTLGSADGLVPGPGFSFAESGNGDWLLARGSNAVLKFDGKKFIQSPELGNLARIKHPYLLRDADGTFYSLGGASVSWFDGSQWLDAPPPDGGKEMSAQAMTAAASGGVWVTANRQVARLQRGTWVESLGEIPWPRKRVRAFAMMEDSTGTLWIGTYGEGLYHRTGNAWSAVEGLPAQVVRALLEDHEGSIWVGTDGGGLSRLKPKLFTNYTTKDGLPENIITAVREVKPGEMWIGTHGGGLCVLKGDKFSPIKFPELTNNRWVWALTADHSGTVWGGTFGAKLFSFPNGIYTELEIPKAGGRESVTAILEDRHGALWVGTKNGLLCYTNGIPREFTTRDGLADNSVRAILETPDGILWIGTERGLNRYESGRFGTFGQQDQVADVRGLLAHQGDLWVGMGSGKGLARIRRDQCVVIKKENGLPHDQVDGLLADDSGNLWATGSHGLCRMALAELEAVAEGKRKTIDAFLYGRDEGLGSRELQGGHQPNLWKSADGRLWFGTIGGLSVIDPRKVKPNTIPPQVWIEDVVGAARPQSSEPAIALPENITIPAGTKQMEIHYTALSFLTPGQVLFKYRIEGYDEDWNLVGNRRVAYYQGLPPGDYRFRVTACNNHGVWNESGASIGLTLLPFFWQTRTFQAAVVVSIIAVLFTIYHRRVSALRRERQAQRDFSQRLISAQEQERKRLAGEIHDGLGQNLSIIKNRAGAARSEPDTGAVAAQLEEIEKSAAEAIQEVRAMTHHLRPYQLDRLGLTLAVQAIVRQFNSPSLTISAEIETIDKSLPAEQEIHFYRIIQEGLNNVVKHAGAKHVWLTIKKVKSRIVVELRDDGRGFDYNALMSDPAAKRGLGLTGLVERAHTLNGDLQVDSMPGRGTRVIMTVPSNGQTVV